MSAQHLNARSMRRIERDAGVPVLRAWSHGGYTMAFVTPDHRHGFWSKKTGEVRWAEPDEPLLHYSSCRDMFAVDDGCLPVHLPMPVDADGGGPADPQDAVKTICWCADDDCEVYP